MKLLKCLLLSLLFVAVPLFAHEMANGLGFAAGELSGIGFSYRYLPEDYGFQVSFGVLSLSNKDDVPQEYTGTTFPGNYLPSTEPYPYSYSSRETHANIGLMLMKVLHRAKRSRFYVMTGFSYFYRTQTYTETYYGYRMIDATTFRYGPVGNEQERKERKGTTYGGIAIGMEFKVTDNIRFALEWPLTYSSNGDLVMYYPQAGLHYFFK
jgi:hypothetical protein